MSEFIVESTPIVDRSTLQRYATCPAQARFAETGVTELAGYAAASGEEAHKAVSETVTDYIESQGSMTPRDIADALERNLRCARPDVQPDAIKAFRASTWAFASMLNDVHFANILHYDGGVGERSGQLAWDLEGLNVRVTAEVDLLIQTACPELVHLHDWKTGWGTWDEGDVYESFQFQCYSWLILHNYPTMEGVRVTVWNTRHGTRTFTALFKRSDLPAITTRIASAAGEWLRCQGREPAKCPTWPTVEKCRICSAALVCPAADVEPKTIAESPDALLSTLVALGAKSKAIIKLLTAYTDKTGTDLVTPSGKFGRNKPSKRKPNAVLYDVTDGDDGDF